MKNAVIIRSSGNLDRLNFVMPHWMAAKGIDVYIAIDSVSKDIEKGIAGNFSAKEIYITRNFIDDNGLKFFKRSMWQCGDYFYYAVYEKFNQYDYYWCIDDDVYFNTDITQFILKSNETECDLFGVEVGPRDKKWGWYNSMSHLHDGKVFGMLYPMSRLSNRAVQFLFKERPLYNGNVERSVYETANGLIAQHANDEAFTASTLLNSGYSWKSLSQSFQKEFSALFSTTRPVLYQEIQADYARGKIIHPICDEVRAAEKIRNYIKKYGRTGLDVRISQILQSCGEDVLKKCLG
ncbi:hypothetical protein [Paenirhodobacter enshiensis]|uniref:hypothetical protein n=1 Tax=Paenirhodobacter enshiensis TaxID=1105367 RepID=UPI0012679513|nr:hypothetical protein [Paenirhodobacter enshiensis]